MLHLRNPFTRLRARQRIYTLEHDQSHLKPALPFLCALQVFLLALFAYLVFSGAAAC